MGEYIDLLDPSQSDELSKLDEQIAEAACELALMEDEEPRLKILIEAAKQVTHETKIASILDLVEGRLRSGRSSFSPSTKPRNRC